MDILTGCFLGFFLWFLLRLVLTGIYTVDQNERAVKTSFGRAERLPGKTTLDDPIAGYLREEERSRYAFPQVRVIPPGGPYLKMPWEKVHKVRIATTTINMALDVEVDQLRLQPDEYKDYLQNRMLNPHGPAVYEQTIQAAEEYYRAADQRSHMVLALRAMLQRVYQRLTENDWERERREREEYLADSADLYDLEARMRRYDRFAAGPWERGL